MLHKVEWTGEKVAEFWNNTNILVNRDEKNGGYFAEITGPYLLKKVNKIIKFKNLHVADYGCGEGFLIHNLCKCYKPQRVCGVDLSEQAVEDTIIKCKEFKCFGGAAQVSNISEFSPNSFDVVFLTEVVEHMSDEDMQVAIANIKSMLRANGYIVISTPNDEDLKNAICVCPDCGCYYHWVQHVRSWNRSSLCSHMEKYGFKEYKTVTTTLFAPEFLKPIFASAYSVFAKVLHRKQKNLIYIGINEKDMS